MSDTSGAGTGLPLFSGWSFTGFLFDTYVTILSSIASVERVWNSWAHRHRIDAGAFLPTIHCRRAEETTTDLNLPDINIEHEIAYLTRAEMAEVDGIRPIEGAGQFLDALPQESRAIVTSAKRELALRRIEAAALPIPQVLICADDLNQGKPAPDGFLLAARRLGVNPSECLVFGDALPGVGSAEADGSSVIVIGSSDALGVTDPSVPNYDGVSLTLDPTGRMRLWKTEDPPA